MIVKSLYPIIVTEDMEGSKKFYGMLGFTVKHDTVRKDGGHVVVLANGDMEMELMETAKAGPVVFKPGVYGFRMNVDDIDKAAQELKAEGYEVPAEPITTPMGKNLLIKDNAGNNITLIQHIK